jgi:hypothetical protein
MGVALLQPQALGRVNARIHTGQDGELTRRGQGQPTLGEAGGVALVGRENLIEHCHAWSPFQSDPAARTSGLIRLIPSTTEA